MALVMKLTNSSTSARLARRQPAPFSANVGVSVHGNHVVKAQPLLSRTGQVSPVITMSRTASAVSKRRVVRCLAALAEAAPGKTTLGFVGIGIMGLAMVSNKAARPDRDVNTCAARNRSNIDSMEMGVCTVVQ